MTPQQQRLAALHHEACVLDNAITDRLGALRQQHKDTGNVYSYLTNPEYWRLFQISLKTYARVTRRYQKYFAT